MSMSTSGVGSREVDPLKGEEGDVSTSRGNNISSPLKKTAGGGKLQLSHLSGWRTAAFLLSLFLSLTVIFAFSFILPCPTRSQYLTAWNRTLLNAVGYDFLAVDYANKDKTKDVIFIYKSGEGTQNSTCEDAGLLSPCIFVLAVDGTDGENLWERPLSSDLHWAQCGLAGLDPDSAGCLLAHADRITAISIHTGEVTWSQSRAGNEVLAPVLNVPDLNEDKWDDIAILISQHTQTKLKFLSGRTGSSLGTEVDVSTEISLSNLLHQTVNGAQYLLLHTGSGLYAEGLWSLVMKAGLSKQMMKDPDWEKRRNGTGLIPIYNSPSLQGLLSVTGGAGVPSLLLITTPSGEQSLDSSWPKDSVLHLLDGESLDSVWRANSSALLSKPSFGHFNKDGVPDVVIEEDAGSSTKRVLILDGKTGEMLWSVPFLTLPHVPSPASVLTTHSYSVFMLWGEKVSSRTDSELEKQFSYLLHPSYSNLLLQRNTSVEHIIAFKASLLERGRHAAYVLLTGPSASRSTQAEVVGPLVLSKRKIKSDVPDSLVLSWNGPVTEDAIEHVKEAFSRLRFSDQE